MKVLRKVRLFSAITYNAVKNDTLSGSFGGRVAPSCVYLQNSDSYRSQKTLILNINCIFPATSYETFG